MPSLQYWNSIQLFHDTGWVQFYHNFYYRIFLLITEKESLYNRKTLEIMRLNTERFSNPNEKH